MTRDQQTNTDSIISWLKDRKLIAVLVVVGLVIIWLAQVTTSIEHIANLFNGNGNTDSARSGISVRVPEGMSMESAIIMLAQQRKSGVEFSETCSEQILDQQLRGGSFTGEIVNIMENFSRNLVNAGSSRAIRAEYKKEENLYEITCVN